MKKLSVASILLALAVCPAVGCGQVCDLDRPFGRLTVDASAWLADEPFDVEVTAGPRSAAFGCGARVDGERTTQTIRGDDLWTCAPSGFTLSTDKALTEATFTLTQQGVSHQLVVQDVAYVQGESAAGCREPQPIGGIEWVSP